MQGPPPVVDQEEELGARCSRCPIISEGLWTFCPACSEYVANSRSVEVPLCAEAPPRSYATYCPVCRSTWADMGGAECV